MIKQITIGVVIIILGGLIYDYIQKNKKKILAKPKISKDGKTVSKNKGALGVS